MCLPSIGYSIAEHQCIFALQKVLNLRSNRSIKELRLSWLWSKNLHNKHTISWNCMEKVIRKEYQSSVTSQYLGEAKLVHLLANAFFTELHSGRAFWSMKHSSFCTLKHHTTLNTNEICFLHLWFSQQSSRPFEQSTFSLYPKSYNTGKRKTWSVRGALRPGLRTTHLNNIGNSKASRHEPGPHCCLVPPYWMDELWGKLEAAAHIHQQTHSAKTHTR